VTHRGPCQPLLFCDSVTSNPTSRFPRQRAGTHRLASVSLFAGGTDGAGSTGGTGSAGGTHGTGLAAIALRREKGVVRPARFSAGMRGHAASERRGKHVGKLTFTPAAPSLPGGPSAPGLPWEKERNEVLTVGWSRTRARILSKQKPPAKRCR